VRQARKQPARAAGPVTEVRVTGRPAGITVTLVRQIVAAVVAGEAAMAPAPKYLSVTFLFAPAMRRLNREWLGHDCPTDVLSFSLTHPDGATSGDVYICPTVAAEAARERAITPREELVRLVVHGTLHVLGYNHPEGPGRMRSRMWLRQERYVKALA
jgi:probable rRNA maturation factor